MPEQLRFRTFDAFLGTNESIQDTILPAIFSSGGSQNVWIDKFARVRKISGYDNVNVSAIATNGGNASPAVVGLFSYQEVGVPPNTQRLIIAVNTYNNEQELWYSTDDGVTSTFKYQYSSSATPIVPDFLQVGNDLYFTAAGIAPLVQDQSTHNWSAAGGTQSPTPTATAAGTTGVLNGNYTYKLVSMDGTTRSPGSASATVESVQNGQISLSWSADADTDIDGYEVYRTTGTGSTFYFVSWIEGRATVAFTDNISDETIQSNRVLDEHGDAPPSVYFMVSHKQRVWWLRTDALPFRAWFSDPGDPDSVYTYNNMDFTDSDTWGDFITGGVGDFNGRLVIFTERAVWTVSGTGQLLGNLRDWTRMKSNASIGASARKSIIRVPIGAKFTDQNGVVQTTNKATIAYFTPNNDIRLFDGDSDTIISLPMKETLSNTSVPYRYVIHALHDIENGQIIWFYPDTRDNIPGTDLPMNWRCSRAVVWNYIWGVWYAWTDTPFQSSCVTGVAASASFTTGRESALLVGDSRNSGSLGGGYIYEFFDTGNDANGAAIEAIWMSKILRGQDQLGKDDLHSTQRFRWIDLLFESSTSSDLTVEWLYGKASDTDEGVGEATVGPENSVVLTSDGQPIVTSSGEVLYATGEDSSQRKVLLRNAQGRYLHDTGIRLKVSDNSSTSTWALNGIVLAYQTLPGQKRRFN